jgi:shikimate dehydrogenase
MPGCGKTTIGQMLSERLNREFIDTDTEIIKQTGKSIPDIFKECGEEGFRNIEAQIIAEVSLKQGVIIATGGGAILRKRNIDLLRENGRLYFLDRPLDMLVVTDDRPLSSNSELLTKRYNERYDIYCSSADIKVIADGSIEENTNRVKEAFLNENSCN